MNLNELRKLTGLPLNEAEITKIYIGWVLKFDPSIELGNNEWTIVDQRTIRKSTAYIISNGTDMKSINRVILLQWLNNGKATYIKSVKV